MQTFKEFREEPANVSGPNIAGKDVPFFDKAFRKKKFMNTTVFDVSTGDFQKAKFGKQKFERMKRFFDNVDDGIGKDVHDFSKKFPNKGIIVRDLQTGSMMFLKKPKK